MWQQSSTQAGNSEEWSSDDEFRNCVIDLSTSNTKISKDILLSCAESNSELVAADFTNQGAAETNLRKGTLDDCLYTCDARYIRQN